MVLGGGGLVGHAWHVGVMAGLAEVTGWDPRRAELIVGTSAGAVVAAELRAGLHPADLLRPGIGAAPTTLPQPVLNTRSWMPAAPGMAMRAVLARAPAGLLAAGLAPRGRRDPAIIADAVARLYPDGCNWPDRPLWVCAVRLGDGQRIVFSGQGDTDVATAVSASCAMSGFFTPVPVGSDLYVDGGARSVTNAGLVAGAGFDLVLVSSPMSFDRATVVRPRWRAPTAAHLQRAVHATRLRREVADLRHHGATVVTFEPGPDDLPIMGSMAMAMDFGRRAAVIEQARASTLRKMGSAPLEAVRSHLSAATNPGSGFG